MPTGVVYYNIFDSSSKATKVVSGTTLIAEEIRVLIGFQKYGLFFGNEMGLGAEKYIHLTNKLATFNLIKADIEQLFNKYKRARLIKVEMQFDDASNTLIIDLTVATNIYGQNVFNISFALDTQ